MLSVFITIYWWFDEEIASRFLSWIFTFHILFSESRYYCLPNAFHFSRRRHYYFIIFSFQEEVIIACHYIITLFLVLLLIRETRYFLLFFTFLNIDIIAFLFMYIEYIRFDDDTYIYIDIVISRFLFIAPLFSLLLCLHGIELCWMN